MIVIESVTEMQRWAIERNREGARVGFVPTMGYLHEGHLALIREAKERSGPVVVSIFVNPLQFGPNEDLDAYPRDFDRDKALCEREGVDVVFFPSANEMYLPENRTRVVVEGMHKPLCGRSRPGHFIGVATVVLKLFEIVRPAVAVFGWKDAQQFLMLRRMTADLNLPLEMIGVETIREPDGLALSSRNKYLSETERREAAALNRSLAQAKKLIEEQGEKDAQKIRDEMLAVIGGAKSGRLDYCEIVSMNTLEPLEKIEPGNTLIAVAAYFGRARLIDNIRL